MVTKRSIKLIVMFVSIGILGWVISTQISRRGMDKLVITVIPSDSTILIGEKKIHSGTTYVTPGEYTLTASRKDFVKKTKKINSNEIKNTTTYILLDPANSAGDQWFTTHPKEASLRENIISDNISRQQAEFQKKNPILAKLPVYNSDYRIDYSSDAANNIEYQITLYAIINGPADRPRYLAQLKQYKAEAINFLKSSGVDVTSARISYTPDI